MRSSFIINSRVNCPPPTTIAAQPCSLGFYISSFFLSLPSFFSPRAFLSSDEANYARREIYSRAGSLISSGLTSLPRRRSRRYRGRIYTRVISEEIDTFRPRMKLSRARVRTLSLRTHALSSPCSSSSEKSNVSIPAEIPRSSAGKVQTRGKCIPPECPCPLLRAHVLVARVR